MRYLKLVVLIMLVLWLPVIDATSQTTIFLPITGFFDGKEPLSLSPTILPQTPPASPPPSSPQPIGSPITTRSVLPTIGPTSTAAPADQDDGTQPKLTATPTAFATIQPDSEISINQYQKLELTFNLPTAAANPYLPFDSSPPAGIQPQQGVTVNVLFSPDQWQTAYTQPAFYYQEFDEQIKGEQEWFYPTGKYKWMVRFSPPTVGRWQYKVTRVDQSGYYESVEHTFYVNSSANPGFIRVSERDPRYFEFENGDYFAALGYNLNYRQVDWVDPTLANRDNFASMSNYGIQLLRVWLSQWGIYSSIGNPWKLHVNFNETGLSFDEAYGDSDVSLRLLGQWNRCVVHGWETAKMALKRDTDYRIRVRLKITEMGPALDPSQPHGFVVKEGGWFGGPEHCYQSGTGALWTQHVSHITDGWVTVEGGFNSGNRDYSDLIYFALENVEQGAVWIDAVWIEEELDNGQFGPNILSRWDMDHHTYYDQRNSRAFDKVLELAEENGLYFKLVLLDKLELIQNRIDYQGTAVPEHEFSNRYFYGNGRQMTKVRWYQQAYLRYVQARWGYSPHIHSWEILNEGDPFSQLHYDMVDELGGYLKQFAPNDHLVSTSTWHSFPEEQLWDNPSYPNIDYADIHKYVSENEDYWTYNGTTYLPDFSAEDFFDAARVTVGISSLIGAKESYGAGKPVIRGELGFLFSNADLFAQDEVEGLWLHNLIWGGINAGGLIESYWNAPPTANHIEPPGSDYRKVYRAYRNFITDIPLNNGYYEDAKAQSTKLRVWGQKDLTNSRAHLWIQHPEHTWNSVWQNHSYSPSSDVILLEGFMPNATFVLNWWDTREGEPVESETINSDDDGRLSIKVAPLRTDIALKLYLQERDS